jgi:GntR family transcriptional repressor for pyruvate dehydrogenase complex
MGVADEAIVKIKEMIVGGELTPGQRLPSEKELSEHLGLSRASLREAAKALEAIGVLDVRRGDGTYVTSLEPRILLDALSFVVDLHADSSILDILTVRRILEPAATSMAVAGMTPETAAALRALVEDVDVNSSVDLLVEHELQFHRTIVALSGNPYLTSLLDSLLSTTVRARIWRWLTEEESIARTIDEHRAIVEALVRGDALLANALTTAHISGVERSLRNALDTSPGVEPS